VIFPLSLSANLTLLAWKRDSNWWRRTPSKGVLGDLCIQVWFNFRLFLICFLGFDLFAWSQIDCLCNLFTAMGLDWGFVLWSILLLQIDLCLCLGSWISYRWHEFCIFISLVVGIDTVCSYRPWYQWNYQNCLLRAVSPWQHVEGWVMGYPLKLTFFEGSPFFSYCSSY
jgi:hypothetical protein